MLKILDTLDSSILSLDPNDRITYANASAEVLFESRAENLVGRRFSDLMSVLEPSTILTKLQHQTSTLTEWEAMITLANGKALLADYSIYPISESLVGEKVIEIRLLERQRQIAREESNQIQKQASQQLARGLAHEINNPLGGIRGAAQLLQKALDNPNWQEYTDIIITEVDRLQSLTQHILGAVNRPKFNKINILEVLEHVRIVILAANTDRIVIERDYDTSIPELHGDRDLLIQVFLNLTRNAVQAIDDRGEIIFKTRIGRRITLGQKTHRLVACIEIIDNGHGISKELSDTIFLPMITDKPEGSGLGLPIAQEIVSRHGGKIELHSSETGTTSTVIIPLEQS